MSPHFYLCYNKFIILFFEKNAREEADDGDMESVARLHQDQSGL